MLQDPFYVVREEVKTSVDGIQTLYSRWKELLHTTNTAKNDEFRWTSSELKSGIRSIEWDVQDLEETVNIVERNRKKFQLDDDEIKRRKAFISEIQAITGEIKSALNSAEARGKQESDERNVLMKSKKTKRGANGGGKYSRLEESLRADNDDFIANQEQAQLQIRAEQDEDLSALSQTVGVLGQIGLTINQELETQTKILEEFDQEVDETSSAMHRANKKIDKILEQTKSSKIYCFIFLLMVVLMILVVLVFET